MAGTMYFMKTKKNHDKTNQLKYKIDVKAIITGRRDGITENRSFRLRFLVADSSNVDRVRWNLFDVVVLVQEG